VRFAQREGHWIKLVILVAFSGRNNGEAAEFLSGLRPGVDRVADEKVGRVFYLMNIC
jgi:hypothetical protein